MGRDPLSTLRGSWPADHAELTERSLPVNHAEHTEGRLPADHTEHTEEDGEDALGKGISAVGLGA